MNKKINDYNKCVILFLLWISFVCFMIFNHKFWFDEVVNLVYGIGADPVYGIHGNGHPSIWFLFLRFGYYISGSYIVLPLISFIVATIAIYILIFKSPFDFKYKAVISFSGFALYEYVVMARNYGISMLLMFILAIVFSNKKYRNTWTGVILLLIENTNVHSVILCFSFFLGWLINVIQEKSINKRHDLRVLCLNGSVMLVGAIICFLTIYPPFVKSANSLDADNRHIKNIKNIANISTQFYNSSYAPVFDFITEIFYEKEYKDLSHIIKTDHFATDEDFEEINKKSRHIQSSILIFLRNLSKILFSIIMYFSPLCLIRSRGWMISAYVSLVIFGVFFQFIYPGGYRHQALWLVFVIMLLWIEKCTQTDSKPVALSFKKERLLSIGTVSFFILLVFQDINGLVFCYWEESNKPKSPAADFSKFILSHPEWRDGIILDSPDYLNVPTFYYIKNKRFLLSQNRYGIVSPYAPIGIHHYDLDYVLDVAEKINYCNNVPVIMMFENDFYGEKAFSNINGKKYFRLNRIYYFTADQNQVDRLNKEARDVAFFKSGRMESGYTVYIMDKSPREFNQDECKIYKSP
ncbi:hypothetical protein HNW77_08310 [Komagataeibacter sp. AV436]|uniref:Glycosyltransferase RgtA/B/C/D-like domain-containing protein n=1 Tax=Komagataeibacter melomenusus TaxID=2766578 RepID=A0ABX2AE03_9PROT|nr:hypothetical protein [Komagataeibacter melomenusus]MBV1830685.1 hypothetical protein [Komagataeibacter melomenusus]NPC66391.1 hypothetical protein [Komagataeibacter melomenusus]